MLYAPLRKKGHVKMKHVLKKKSASVQLLHVTCANSLKFIMKEGVCASAHGIFSGKGSN